MAKYFRSTLQKGSTGDEVKEWQNFLNTQGYSLTVDGVFGDNTLNATTEWQTKQGLGADGIVGENTWGKAGYTNYSTISTPKAPPTTDPAPDKATFNTTATALPTTDTTSWDDTEKGKAAGEAYETAKGDVDSFEAYTYGGYTKGEDVIKAENAYNDHLTKKPGEYTSQWQGILDNLMNRILNREKFSYDLDGDALYQQYKDKYVQQGKLAMSDAIGQASAMTGGYGNSYAQSVGQQQYQASLDNLNDIIPQLYQMSLDKYKMEGQDLYNQFGMVADRESTDYGRYMDALNTWMADRGFLAERMDTALNFDYGKHMDEESIKQSIKQDEYKRLMDALGITQSDYYNGADMYYTEQDIRNSEAWKQYEASETARRDENSLIQQNWQNEFNTWDANTQNEWKQWQADEDNRQALYDDYWKQEEWDRDETWHNESNTGSGGNGGNGNGGSVNTGVMFDENGNLKEGYTTTNPAYFDEHGNFKQATLSRSENGNAVWYIDGKEVIRRLGANPYTGKHNPDVLNNGVFDPNKVFPNNPYQPNNIHGQPLSKYMENGVPVKDSVNGVEQSVFQTPDGKLWIWDDTQNKYESYTQ